MKAFASLSILLTLLSCSRTSLKQPTAKDREYHEISDYSPRDTLFRVSKEEYELGVPFCYVNGAGDTVIPYGRFLASYTDTLITFGIVLAQSGELIGINQQGQRLYEVHPMDNGPDHLSEGLFRILRNGRIGFADAKGQIVLKPKFICAHPFSEGRAKVSFTCHFGHDDEYTSMLSERWHYIDRYGQLAK